MKRAKWKGTFIISKNNKSNVNVVLPRNFEVTAHVVGSTCLVHSGKKYVKLTLVEDMLNHKLGEFVPTREKFVFKKKKKK